MSTIIRFDNILWGRIKGNPDDYPQSAKHDCECITDETIEEDLFKEHLETLYGGVIDTYTCRFITNPLDVLDELELEVLGSITSMFDEYSALDFLTEVDPEVADALIELKERCVPALQDLMYLRDSAIEETVFEFQMEYNDLDTIREFISDLA